MTMTTSSIIPTDASALAVDTSCIDVSEVDSQEDKDFLLQKGENILRIVAKAALEVGQQLVEIQDRFNDEKKLGLVKFYESIHITKAQAADWSNKYRAYCAYIEIFGDDEQAQSFESLKATTISNVWRLPTEYREAFLADIAAGNPPKLDTVKAVASQPEVKLTKAQELLAAAKVRKGKADEEWELVKADPQIAATDPEYNSANNAHKDATKSVKLYEQQIADLEAAIEEEKLRTAEQAQAAADAEAARAAIEKDLQKLKFDDAKVKAERVKKLSTTLTVSLPQALADVSKFFAEIDHYPEDVRQHIYSSAKALANEIADRL